MKRKAKEIIDKYVEGAGTAEEKALLEDHFNHYLNRDSNLPSHDRIRQAAKDNYRLILQRAGLTGPSRKIGGIFTYRQLAAAAILIVAIATALYFYRRENAPSDIAPGYNQATLTLSDGTKIALDSAQSGIIVSDDDIKYNDGKKIGVKGVAGAPDGTPILSPFGGGRDGQGDGRGRYLALSTPRGGQYQVILSDGTKVWLNAASTLKYPSRFTGGRREVELEGEAYFLVAQSGPDRSGSPLRSEKSEGRGRNIPFIVKSQNQSITVLGTEFNVAAYADENSIKTTLVNGAVRITNSAGVSVSLVPNEQSTIQLNGSLTKSKADIETATAWKNGYFSFNNTPLEEVMKQLSRWYNMEVMYEDTSLKMKIFSGSVSRFAKASQVLKKLGFVGGVSFRITGKGIIVEKSN